MSFVLHYYVSIEYVQLHVLVHIMYYCFVGSVLLIILSPNSHERTYLNRFLLLTENSANTSLGNAFM